jgi:hypothetical protein
MALNQHRATGGFDVLFSREIDVLEGVDQREDAIGADRQPGVPQRTGEGDEVLGEGHRVVKALGL